MTTTDRNTFDFAEPGQRATVVREHADGDLIIRGLAAVWDGVDRQGENFAPGAFRAAIEEALSRAAGLPLCYHHDRSKALGEVLELNETDAGLEMVARVDGEIRHDPVLKTIYAQIKRGTLRALSVGGLFKRKLTAAGWRIARCDLTEISVTPVPVLAGPTGPSFAVVAGKALTAAPDLDDLVANIASDIEEAKALLDADDRRQRERELYALRMAAASVNGLVRDMHRRDAELLRAQVDRMLAMQNLN